MEARTRQRFAEDTDAPDAAAEAVPRLRLFAEEQHRHQAQLFQDSGYRIVRYFNEMHRSLEIGVPEAVLADGLELVPFGPELHEPVRLAHNDAFRDHWGSEPRDGESWGSW